MRDGIRTCVYCGTRLEFEDYELVEASFDENAETCLGCVRLLDILAESGRRKAQAAAGATKTPEPMDLSPAANLERLRAGSPSAAVRDWARAAANDGE